jgi:hypothetical protein
VSTTSGAVELIFPLKVERRVSAVAPNNNSGGTVGTLCWLPPYLEIDRYLLISLQTAFPDMTTDPRQTRLHATIIQS